MVGQTTKIRKAEIKDVENIYQLVFGFYKEELARYNFSLSRNSLIITIENAISNQIVFVAEKNEKIVGVVGGALTPSIFNLQQTIGQEMVWYLVEDERKGLTGIKLMTAFEKRCKEKGATLVSMVHIGEMDTVKLSEFYKKRGYKLLETQYIKTL